MVTFPSLIYPDGQRTTPVPTIEVDQTGNYAPAVPLNLITGSGQGDGSQRLRVDVGQTSFFAKREFRTFYELSIPNGQKQLFRFVTTANVIIEDISLVIDDGSARLSTYSGGTPTGTFVALPQFACNNMTEGPAAPASSVTSTRTDPGASVAIAGGAQLDIIRLVTAGSSAQAQSVGSSTDSYRGIAPGTYYVLIENFGTGSLAGVVRFRWEQRP